jgi:tRNA threonylcarbamoyladenosine biosynthesis protein TsaE
MEIITKTEQETFEFAKEFAKSLKGGEVLGLSGDLGAGKTVFAKGLAAGLNVKETVTSPTFVIMKIYPADLGKIKKFVHIDAYRIKGNDIYHLGGNDYLGRPDTVSLVEWVENVRSKTDILINIEIDGNSRKIKKA